MEQYKDFFAALEKTSPFVMGFEALSGGIKGRCNYEEKRIFINEGMDELQNIKTAIHEIAHATLHDTAHCYSRNAPTAVPARYRRKASPMLSANITGLIRRTIHFGYIAGWSSGKELAELKGSLETIRSTAANLIDTIDGHFCSNPKGTG